MSRSGGRLRSTGEGPRQTRPTRPGDHNAEVPADGHSAGVVLVRVRLLLDELNEVAACVIKDGHDSGADVGRRLGEYHAVAGQPGMLSLDVVDGELSEWDAVFDNSIPIRLHGGVI
jgi:hypothetical protein